MLWFELCLIPTHRREGKDTSLGLPSGAATWDTRKATFLYLLNPLSGVLVGGHRERQRQRDLSRLVTSSITTTTDITCVSLTVLCFALEL